MKVRDVVRFEELPAAGQPRRRVLFVTNMWPDELREYYGSFIASQARSLTQVGVAVDVAYIRGFLGAHAYLQAFFELPRIARRKKYDVIHIHYGHAAASGIRIRQRPLIVSFCGEDLLGAPRSYGITLKSRVEVSVFRQLARRATATITKSVEMARVLPAGVRSRNAVLPNGVDLEMFSPMSVDRARAELGWSQDEQVMLFLGNPNDPRKNVGLAENAAALVTARLPSARLEIAWEIAPERVPVLMNAANCLVFPSKSEGSPNAVKEAMACALPIVATPVGDIPELLAGVESCYLCEPSPQAFAAALLEALAGGRAPMARSAIERLGINCVAERLLTIYDEALGCEDVTAGQLKASSASPA